MLFSLASFSPRFKLDVVKKYITYHAAKVQGMHLTQEVPLRYMSHISTLTGSI
jgi:hypothetical protein